MRQQWLLQVFTLLPECMYCSSYHLLPWMLQQWLGQLLYLSQVAAPWCRQISKEFFPIPLSTKLVFFFFHLEPAHGVQPFFLSSPNHFSRHYYSLLPVL